jgi:hypothetical protein
MERYMLDPSGVYRKKTKKGRARKIRRIKKKLSPTKIQVGGSVKHPVARQLYNTSIRDAIHGSTMPVSKNVTAPKGRLIVTKEAVLALKSTKNNLKLEAQQEILKNAIEIAKVSGGKTVKATHVATAKKLYRVC